MAVHRYWRLFLDGCASFAYTISEVQFRPVSGTSTPFPGGGTASAAETYSGQVASMAADGDPNTFWGAPDVNAGQWWQWDYGAGNGLAQVAELFLQTRNDGNYAMGPSAFHVAHSDDGTNWTTDFSATANWTSAGQTMVFENPNAVPGYTLTVSGASGARTGVAQTVTVTPSAALASATVITLASDNGGTFAATTLNFASGATAAQTTTFTPVNTGTTDISSTNNQSLRDPVAVTETVTTVGYTLTAPSTGVINAQQTLTITPNTGTEPGGTVTLSQSPSNSGTLSQTSFTFAANATTAQTATFSPTAVGTVIFSIANSAGVANSAPVSDAIAAMPPGFVTVDNPAFLFSPGNWKGNAGRGGSGYRQSWNPGASFLFTWTASSSPTLTIEFNSTNSGCVANALVNGVLVSESVACTSNLVISPSNITASAVNVLELQLGASPQTARWNNAANTMQVTGIQMDASSTAGTSSALANWALISGDSITEGIEAGKGGSSNCLYDYSHAIATYLRTKGYDTCINACGFSGWNITGDSGADVPAYHYLTGSTNGSGGTYDPTKSRDHLVDAGVSVLDSNGHFSRYGATGTEPGLFISNLGVNDPGYGTNLSDMQAVLYDWCADARARSSPGAQIVWIVPFFFGLNGQTNLAQYGTAGKAGIAAYKAATGDNNVHVIELGVQIANMLVGQNTSDGLHPSLYGHAIIAPIIVAQLDNILFGSTATAAVPVPTYAGGFHPS
jgi:lysophospholipase L1-like esterase